MPYRGFEVAPGHDVWVDAHTNGDVGVGFAKTFDGRDVVQIDANAQTYGFFNLAEIYSAGRVKDIHWFKSCPHGDLHLLNGHTIDGAAQLFDELQDGDIGQRFTRVTDFEFFYLESSFEAIVLPLNGICFVDVKW